MKDTDKQLLQGQISAASAQCHVFKAMLQSPAPPVMAGSPPLPINIAPGLTPLLTAVKLQGESIEKLLKLLGDVVAKS